MSIAEKLTTVAENQQKVYDAGFMAGQEAGGGGGDGYYDSFWDAYQQNGRRTDYANAFPGACWTDENFCPKYDIKPTGSCNSIFQNTAITDLKGICEEQGIVFDFSGVTTTSNPVEKAKITRMPTYDVSNITNCATVLRYAQDLVWVDEVVLNESGTQTFGTGNGYHWMIYAGNLVHCPIRGKIGANVWFASDKLDDGTIQSIVDALMDLTGQTSQKVSFHTNVLLKLTEEQALAISAKNWTF